MKHEEPERKNVVLVGAGIMSATLGIFLKELDPSLSIEIIERLDVAAGESSDPWNNAGTGHSAFCELNYTPERKDGTIDISKAEHVAEQFELSRQFWSYLVEKGSIQAPQNFIHNVPHMSFVWGADNVVYLKKRHAAMTKSPLFKGMKYSDRWNQLESWMPLVMAGRDPGIEVAATHMEIGTDVNFGALTKILLEQLALMEGVTIKLKQEVEDLKKTDGRWEVTVKDLESHQKRQVLADFIFIGAGGGALPLLEKSDIREAEGYGGFPVSGQWLRCTNEEVVAQHTAKVYGKASVGSPPMSVPHLDTRIIDGKKALMFGPYAGFSTKFLKQGSYWDLPASLERDNILPMISAGLHNLPLTKYLVKQALQSPKDRLAELLEYFPDARMQDWELKIAGQRVQVIKKDEHEGGILEFGTEVVSAADGSLAAMLGASPGASTAVAIMLDILKRCFKDKMNSDGWQAKIKKMVPTYGKSLGTDEALCFETRKRTSTLLSLIHFERDQV